MGQFMRREERHPLAGLWGISLTKWHRLEWVEDGDGSMTDGGSACGAYMGPLYLSGFELHHLKDGHVVCRKCARRAGP